MRPHGKTLLGALIWAVITPAPPVQAQDQDEDKKAATPARCLTPGQDTLVSGSGIVPARAAATADSGPPDNGFPPPARLDDHGQPLAPAPAPPRPRAGPSQCVKACEAGYVLDAQQQWCRRSSSKVIHIDVSTKLKPAGVGASFTFKRKGKLKGQAAYKSKEENKNIHRLDPAKLQPWQGRVRVRVLGGDGKPLAGQAVKLTQTVEEDSGSHPKSKHTGPRPLGALFQGKTELRANQQGEIVTTLRSDAQGQIPLFFSAPEFAGIHRLKAECVQPGCNSSEGVVTVKVPNLEPYTPATGKAQLIGGRNEKHEQRHYLTKPSIENLRVMIDAMNDAGWKPVGVNDAALPWGGLFDISGEWWPSHFDHGAGTAVDLRTKQVTLDIRAAVYKDQCSKSDKPNALSNRLPTTKILWHSDQGDVEHLHVYLEGTAPNGTQRECKDAGGWLARAEAEAKKPKAATKPAESQVKPAKAKTKPVKKEGAR
ncbi:hypothetical protein HA052_17320 [Chromobacterium haemolyticum]|uniref:Uncharacterized protein n=1 Tax=Chromobacterium fluminis TaxID=3044269 RepID=A0ABX0LBG7_9NEIS|nr:hypothetical protein [Chromobacterium haemolyticum]NHR06951.1 hypothetical protein [Chromobacterium haemolyticum]